MIFGKKFLAILGLLLLVLATSGLAFQVKAQNINAPSFELQYPKLPGLDELVPGQSLVYYVKYFLNLFYVIAVGLAAAALIWGGFMYLTSSQWPSNLVKARAIINRSLLGLAILLSSYLFLVIVNPGLLLYDVKFPVANRTPVDEIPIKGCSATFTYAGGLSLAENVLDEMTQVAVTTDAKGNKKSRYAVEMEEKDGKLQPKLDKKGLPITLVDDDGYPVPILAAEEPFYDTYDFLVQAVSITQAIQKETQKCVCGNTLYNIDLTSGGCKPGMAKDEAEAFIKANKTSKLTNQAECLTRCDSCLDKTTKASEGCNLALLVELRTKLQTLLGGAEELKPPFADPPTPVPDTAVPLVKNIRQQTSKFALTRLDFLRKTLENNASEFYIRNAEGSFETDFRSQQQDLIAQGCEVKIETPDFLQSATPDKQIPLQAYQDSQDKKSLASFGKWAGYWKTFLNLALGQGKPVQAQNPKKYFDQTGYYAISDGTGLGGIIPSATIQHNREVERTASNANFTAVILQMSLSELQGIFQRCLSSAFKTGGFKVTVEEMETIVKMAMQSIDTNIIGTIMGNSKALAALMGDTIQKENETAFGEAWVSEVNFCEKKCVLNYVLGKSPVLTEAQDNLGLQDLLNNLGVSLSNTAVEAQTASCKKLCWVLPDKFFSNLITGLLSGTIESRLPSTLQNFLNSDLRDWIFKDGLNVKLDTEAINLVGVTAHNILTQSFVKQFPLIQKKLNQKLSETQYLDVVMRILGKIDKFVASSTAGMLTNLDGLEKNAAKDVGIYLSGKLTGSLDQIVENYKNDNPMYFSDRDLANCNDTLNTGEALMENGSRENLCNKTSPIIDTELARIGLRCLKLTPEEITKLVSFTGDAKVTGDEATGLFSLTWGVCKAAGGNRPRICQSAGYCWDYDGGSNKAGQCKECAYVTVKDANLKGINKGTIIAGAVNGFSSLLSAFLQTIIYTAVKYTEVYVQDNILTPLRPFISQMQAWQTQFHKFVTEGTLADILPSSVTNVLKSNVDAVLKDICVAYKTKQPIKIMKPLSWDNITWDDNTKDDEPGKAVSWKGLEISYDTWTQCVDGKTYRNTNGSNPQGCTNIGEKACDLYANLHKTPMGALDTVYPCDKNPDGTYPCKSLAETLNSRIEDLIDQYDTHCDKDIADCKKYKPEAECTKDKLGCKSFKEYINSPIQELVFGGLISRFAKGNIKQMVCGEVLDQDFGITIDVDNPAKKTLAQYCQTIKLVPTQLTGAVKIIQNSREKTKAQRAKELQKQGFGFFPVIDKEKFTVKTTADQIKQAACYFNYYACQNPLVSFNRQLGNTTAEMLALSCSIVEARVKIGQQGLTCVNWDKPDFTKTQLGKDWQPYCQTCDLMEKHNGAYLMIRTAIEAYYSNKPKDEVEEINTYEWICAGLPDWCNDAKLVAQERKIDVSKMEPYTSLIGIPSNVDAAGKTVLAMFTTPNKTIDDVLIDIPFGVIKPFKTGEASLLRGKGQGSTKNFLSRTPYEFLHNDVCGKIVLDFKDQHPKYTFESLKSGELKKLPKDALPYSVESLAEVTTADVFKALADLNVEAVDIEPEELIAYSTCLSLDYSPAQLMGLDQTMEHYIYPPEFRILFDLINKNSKPEQLPEILNQLFRFIYRDTPASTLSKIGTELATRNQLGIFSINFTYWTPKAKKSDPRFRAGDVSKELEPIITSQNVKKEGEAQLETPATPTLKDAQEIDKKAGGDGKVIAVWQVKDTDYQIWEKALTADAYLYADTGTGEAIKSLASFLGSTIGSHIPNNKKLVSYIVDNKTLVCPKTELLCGKDWQKLFASKTLLNLIADNFEGELFDSDLLKKITDPKYSVMGLLSNRYTWLKTPYLDLLFNTIPKSWQQATAKQYYNASTRYKNYIENPINKAVSAFQSKVQEGFDKALVEAPNWLWDKISELWTKKVGQNFGDNTSGTCRKVVTDSACDTTNLKEIYRETVQPDGSKVMECCSGGQPLVCEPQCRVKPAKENCLFEKGEIEIKDKGQCCYKGLTGRKEDECRQCRLANAREEYTKTCPDKSKPVEVKDAFGGVKFACCIKRASSDVYVNGVATGEKKCCVSVTDCITNQFVDNLSILAEMIAKNAVPVSSLTGLPLSK